MKNARTRTSTPLHNSGTLCSAPAVLLRTERSNGKTAGLLAHVPSCSWAAIACNTRVESFVSMITQSVMFRASLSLCNQRPSAAARPATHTNCRQRAGSVHTNSYTRPMLSTTALQDIFAAVRGSTRLRAVSVQGQTLPAGSAETLMLV